MAARKPTSIRVSDAGRAAIDAIVVATGRPFSEVTRVLLSEALNDPALLRRARARLGTSTE